MSAHEPQSPLVLELPRSRFWNEWNTTLESERLLAQSPPSPSSTCSQVAAPV